MNCFARTPEKGKTLKLKSFSKRPIKVLKQILKAKIEKIKAYHGSGSGGGGEVKHSFHYMINRRFGMTFNKSQLIGKIILINNKRCRITHKAKYDRFYRYTAIKN